METLFTFISEVGFPIAVSIYLLYRIETKLDILIQSIQNLPLLLKDKERIHE